MHHLAVSAAERAPAWCRLGERIADWHGIWLMRASAGRGVVVAGSGVGSDGPVGNGLVPSSSGEVLGRVPVGLRVAAAIGWRLVVVLITVAALAWVISRVQFIVIPVAVAVLLAALLAPAVRLLSGFRWVPRGLATAVVVVGGLAVLGGVLYGLVVAFLAGLPALQAQLGQSFSQIRDWLARGPLHLAVPQLNNLGASIIQALGASQAAMTSGALGVASTVGEIVASALLAIFTLIFFLYDGARIWEFVLQGIPQKGRDRVNVAGRRAFAALVSYTRAVTLGRPPTRWCRVGVVGDRGAVGGSTGGWCSSARSSRSLARS